MSGEGERVAGGAIEGGASRDLAREVLRRVEQGGAYASLALDAALAKSKLSPADRGLVTELVYGVLRHRTRLDRALAAHATSGLKKLSPGALVALRVAAYQLLLLRVPAHAAVNDAVSAVTAVSGPQVASFANAVLRKLSTAGEPPAPPATDVPATLELVHSVPRWLGTRLIAALGKAEALVAAEAMNRPPSVTLRASLDQTTRAALAERVAAERPDAELVPSPLLPEALHVRGGGAPETLAVFQEQLCTVQDVAAQLVGRLCGAMPGERILDACAGVGGKSTHLLQQARAAGGACSVDAADNSRRKLDLGEDAARRLGLTGLRSIELDLTDAAARDQLLAPAYDRVLIDAPCTGLGVLRRHPESKWRMRDGDVRELAALQATLLAGVAARVRPGGVLVYSVCTFTEEEGPAQIARFLAAHADFELAPPAADVAPGVDFAAVVDAHGFLRTWPHRHDADAFFAARMVRKA